MIVYCVRVHVKAEHVEDFKTATRLNHEGTRQEPGNLRFDVLQEDADPTRFQLVEVFRSEEAAAAHKETEHYLKWRDSVADWMASPREGLKHRVICPLEPGDW